MNKDILTCYPSSVHPTLVSTGRWRSGDVPVSPRRSARAPSSSGGTPPSPCQSWTRSCPQSLLDQAFDSARARKTDGRWRDIKIKTKLQWKVNSGHQWTFLSSLTVHSFSKSVPVFTLSKSSPPQFLTCLLLPSLRSVSRTGPERLGSSRKLRIGLSPSGCGEKYCSVTLIQGSHFLIVSVSMSTELYFTSLRHKRSHKEPLCKERKPLQWPTNTWLLIGCVIPAVRAHTRLFFPSLHSSFQCSVASSPPTPVQKISSMVSDTSGIFKFRPKEPKKKSDH